MASTPISIPTNTTNDDSLLRVTRSGALFGVPTVLADGKKVPFFDDGKNYKLPYITHDTYMMTSKGAGIRASPAGVYALRKVEEWKPEMLWHHRIGHAPLNVVGQLEKHATSVHPKVKITREQQKLPLFKTCEACAVSKFNQLEAKQLVNEGEAKA